MIFQLTLTGSCCDVGTTLMESVKGRLNAAATPFDLPRAVARVSTPRDLLGAPSCG